MNDYLMRFCEGIVESRIHTKNTDNPFAYGYKNCLDPDTDVYIYKVSASSDTGQHSIYCFSESEREIGSTVMFTRFYNGYTRGVLLPEIFVSEMCDAVESLEAMTEYFTKELNDDLWINRDERENLYFYEDNAASVQEGQRPSEILDEWIRTQERRGFFCNAEIVDCARDSVFAKCRVDLKEVCHEVSEITASHRIPHRFNNGNSVGLFVCRGYENTKCLHIIPLARGFSKWYNQLDESQKNIFTSFANSASCRIVGRTLHYSGMDIPSCGSTVARCMIIKSNPTMYARALGATSWPKPSFILEPNKKKYYSEGSIISVQIEESLSGKLRYKLAESGVGSNNSTDNSNGTDGADNSNGTNEDALDNEKTLLVVRPEEHLKFVVTDRAKNLSYFRDEMLNGRISSLHYDMLEMIGIYRYLTSNMILRLMRCGYFPRNPNELSNTQKELLNKIIQAGTDRERCVKEGDSVYVIKYNERSDNGRLNAQITKLGNAGLLEKMIFSSKKGKKSTAQIISLKKTGEKLMHALQRRNAKADEFFFAYPVRWVKGILSANQLSIAYIYALNHRYKIDTDLRIQKVLGTEDEKARVGFCLTLQSFENSNAEIYIVGESIRNTVGLSKEHDDMEINDKMPRLLSAVNSMAEKQHTHTILTLVYTDYDEMRERAVLIRETLSKMEVSKWFHLCMTYDMLTMGPIEGMHFVFDENGVLKRETGTEEIIDSYFSN